MNRYRAFNRWFLRPLGVLYVGLVSLSFGLGLEPLSGDLTRLGGYSEREFGWNRPQVRYAQHGTAFGDAYDRYYDVLVLGDSFSTGGGDGYWQDHLHRLTGLSILTIPHEKVGSFDSMAEAPGFRRSPPRVVIVECVERELASVFSRPGDADAAGPTPPRGRQPLRITPTTLPVAAASRPGWSWPLQVDFNLTRDFVYKELRRRHGHDAENQVVRMGLTRRDLFSSARSDELLVFHHDLGKRAWQPDLARRIRRAALKVQAAFEADGRTAFVLMVAPDKLTAYDDFLADPAMRGASKLGAITAGAGLHGPDLVGPLRAAIRSGRQDVYLPNDTHWGAAGQHLAGEAVVGHLRDARIIE